MGQACLFPCLIRSWSPHHFSTLLPLLLVACSSSVCRSTLNMLNNSISLAPWSRHSKESYLSEGRNSCSPPSEMKNHYSETLSSHSRYPKRACILSAFTLSIITHTAYRLNISLYIKAFIPE